MRLTIEASNAKNHVSRPIVTSAEFVRAIDTAEVALHVNVRSGDINGILYQLPKQSCGESITLRM